MTKTNRRIFLCNWPPAAPHSPRQAGAGGEGDRKEARRALGYGAGHHQADTKKFPAANTRSAHVRCTRARRPRLGGARCSAQQVAAVAGEAGPRRPRTARPIIANAPRREIRAPRGPFPWPPRTQPFSAPAPLPGHAFGDSQRRGEPGRLDRQQLPRPGKPWSAGGRRCGSSGHLAGPWMRADTPLYPGCRAPSGRRQ